MFAVYAVNEERDLTQLDLNGWSFQKLAWRIQKRVTTRRQFVRKIERDDERPATRLTAVIGIHPLFGSGTVWLEVQKHARSKCAFRPYFVRASAHSHPNCTTIHFSIQLLAEPPNADAH